MRITHAQPLMPGPEGGQLEVADEAEALEIARTLNEDRRAMPKAERLEVVKALREDEHSTRAIAGALGVSVGTVHDDLSGVQVRTPERVRGLDGKSYPARKEPRPPEAETGPSEGAATVVECSAAADGSTP
jgi:transposase-like protein